MSGTAALGNGCSASTAVLHVLTRTGTAALITPTTGRRVVRVSRGVKAGPQRRQGGIITSGAVAPNPVTPTGHTLIHPTPRLPVESHGGPSLAGGASDGLEVGGQGLCESGTVARGNPEETPLSLADSEMDQPLDPDKSKELGSAGLKSRISEDLVSAIREAQTAWHCSVPAGMDLQEQGYKYQEPYWFWKDKIFIPSSVRQSVLMELHDTPYQGHKGIDRTLQSAAQLNISWQGIRKDVAHFVRTCASCQRAKPYPHKNQGQMVSIPVASAPWALMTADFITELPQTVNGHSAILVVVDKFSKYVILIPCSTKLTAEQCARLMHDHVFCMFGWPEGIISDRDKLFTSQFWKTFMSLQGTQLKLSTAYHPQTDGQTERMNRTLEDMIRHYIGPDQSDWDQWLKVAQFAINNAHVVSTGMTPHYLLFGRHPKTPFHLALLKHCLPDNVVQVPSAVKLSTDLQIRCEQARSYLHAARDRQQAQADKVRKPVQFAEGDQVLLHTQNFPFRSPKGALVKKLLPRWIGPFPVVQRIGKVAYQLQLPSHLQLHPVFHVSKLKPFRSDGRYQPPPAPIIIDNQAEYEVDMIHAHRDTGRGRKTRQYLVRWVGYGPEHDTWEPLSGLSRASDMVDEYWTRVRSRAATTQR